MVGTTCGEAWAPSAWRPGLEAPVPAGDVTPPVLVGLDGGAGGEAALEWAVAEAVSLGAPVHAVTAWSWDARLLAAVGGATAHSAARIRDRQEDQIARVLHRLGASACRIETDLVEGDPASTLLALSGRARLLVVGSHGGTARSAVGSVARACLRSAGCPVVVVPVRAAC